MITTLTSLFICINSINFTTFAEIDLTHTFVEERGLQENTWINLNCKSSSPACKKYLIRYEDAEKLEKINTGKFPSDAAPGTQVHILLKKLKSYL